MELQKHPSEQKVDCIIIFCAITLFSLVILPTSKVPTETEFLPLASLLGVLLFFASPLILIFTYRCFFVNKSPSAKQKQTILLTYVMINIFGYSLLTIAYNSKIIIGYVEYLYTDGGLLSGDDSNEILNKPVYKYEDLGFYILTFGNISYWLFLLVKKRYEEFKFSAMIFPLIFVIIHFFIVLDFPQRQRDTLEEVDHLPIMHKR